MKFCQFDNISVIARVSHTNRPEISTTFYGGYIKSEFFPVYICIRTLYAMCVLIQRKWILETDTMLRIDEHLRNSPSHIEIRSILWISLFTKVVIFPLGAKFFPRCKESKQFSGSHDGNMIPATSRKNDLASFRWIMQYPFRLI